MNLPEPVPSTRVVIVMGVSGSGKTATGRALAAMLDGPFADGDDYHPPHNIAKMAAGQPLTDEDRWPWLDAIGAQIDRWRADGHGGVIACSALRRSYRDRLVSGRCDVVFACLDVPPDILAERMINRFGHFMPPSLLASQLETLETPAPEEPAVIVQIGPQVTVEQVAHAILAGLHRLYATGNRQLQVLPSVNDGPSP